MATPIISRNIDIHGSKMHYLEAGEGDPILLLHSIPLSSASWQKIMPYLAQLGRCIAPDLIGFGESAKPDIAYSVHDHIKYIDGFISSLKLKNITLVMHGFGSVIGCDYAMRNEKNIRGLAFYEAFLHPINIDDISLAYQEQLGLLDDLTGEKLTGADYISRLLPQLMMSDVSSDKLKTYASSFSAKDSTKPITQYFAELPRGDGKSPIDKIIQSYSAKLLDSYIPKLMMYNIPGFITTMATVMWAKEHYHNLELCDIGEEFHLGLEAFPELVGESLSAWLQAIEIS